jgi:hypothetical protein
MICIECGKPYVVPPRPGGVPITCSEDCRRKHRNKVINAWREDPDNECPEHLHGSLVGYVNYKCACDLCRKAAAEYRQKKRLEKKAAPNDA